MSLTRKAVRVTGIVTAILAVVMTATLVLLISEYMFFKREMDTLLALKEDYNNYTLALKKMILEYERAHEGKALQGESEQKKKSTFDINSGLLNREAEYLKQSALRFARHHNLETAVCHLYERDEIKEVAATRQHRKQYRCSTSHEVKRLNPRPSFMQKTVEEWQEYGNEIHIIWPIAKDSFWLSSAFGPRKEPNGSWRFHYGIDMAAARGTPVKAAAGGIVVEAGFAPGYGNTVVLAHGKKYRTRYAHLAHVLVTTGDRVGQGELIGKVGDTGNARKRGKDASHLHFEISILGKKVNPLYFLG